MAAESSTTGLEQTLLNMHAFSHPHATRPTRLLLACLLSLGLAACGGESSDALLDQAKASIAKGDTKAAIIQLKNAVVADEKNADARYQLGQLYLQAGDAASAEKELKRAREAGYAADAVNPLLARALIRQGEFQRVLDELPAPDGQPAEAAAMLILRASAELGLGNKDDARKGLEQAQKVAPRRPRCPPCAGPSGAGGWDAEQGHACHRSGLANRPGPSRRLAAQRRPVARHPAACSGRRRISHRAQDRPPETSMPGCRWPPSPSMRTGSLMPAREVNAVLKAEPNNLFARYTLALIEFRDKKIEAARDQLARVLKGSPNFTPALLLSGAVEYALGNLQTAEAHLNKVVKSAPGNLYALRLLAATQLRLGRADDAARTLAPALKAAPDDAGVRIVAGEIALAKKDFADAADTLRAGRQAQSGQRRHPHRTGASRGWHKATAAPWPTCRAAAAMEGSSEPRRHPHHPQPVEEQAIRRRTRQHRRAGKETAGAGPLTWNYRGAAYLGKKDVAARARQLRPGAQARPDLLPRRRQPGAARPARRSSPPPRASASRPSSRPTPSTSTPCWRWPI